MKSAKTKAKPAKCWCGNSSFNPFSPDYQECTECGTLVRSSIPNTDLTDVSDRESDLYGRSYYEKHLVSDLGQPEIFTRMRQDLPERSLHWLRTVQTFCPAGGSVLEIGCGHGGALALFEASGFVATGLELSPWLVELGKKTWGVDVRCGPIERQNFKPGSFDAIALFDVLEHLQDPVTTIQLCSGLLKPKGVLIVQTPEHRCERSYASIMRKKDPFAQLFIPEHLYLFTRDSAQRLMNQAGLTQVIFETAIFEHYDQYFVAGRKPPRRMPVAKTESRMTSSVAGRLTQALLDLQKQVEESAQNSELARELGETIQQRDREIAKLDGELTHLNAIAQKEAKSHAKKLTRTEDSLKKLESLVESYRTKIEALDRQLTKLNEEARSQLGEKHSALEVAQIQLQELTELAENLQSKVRDLDTQVAKVNEDAKEQNGLNRIALEESEHQKEQLTACLKDNESRLAELDSQVMTVNRDAEKQIGDLRKTLEQSERQREQLTACLKDNESRLAELDSQVMTVNRDAEKQIGDLRKTLEQSERQREQLTACLKDNESRLAELDSQVMTVNRDAEKQIGDLRKTLEQSERQREQLTACLKDNESRLAELDSQVMRVNQDARTQLKEKEKVIKETERQRSELAASLESSNTRLADLDLQLGQLNALAQQQAEEANLRLTDLQQELETERKLTEAVQEENKQIAQETQRAARSTTNSDPLRRAHRETSMAIRLLDSSPPPPAKVPWTPCPVEFAQLPSHTEIVQYSLETADYSHDRVRLGGWAFTLDHDFVSTLPFLVLTAPVHPWILKGQKVERPDVEGQSFPMEGERKPVSSWGFVFEFPVDQLPADHTGHVRIGFGWRQGISCLSAPFELFK